MVEKNKNTNMKSAVQGDPNHLNIETSNSTTQENMSQQNDITIDSNYSLCDALNLIEDEQIDITGNYCL